MGSGSQEVFKTKLVLPGIWFACRSQKGNLNLEYKIHDTENQERDISWILLNIYGGAGHILDPIKHLWWTFIAKIFCKGSNYFGNSYVNLDYYLYDPAWMSHSIKVLSHEPVHNRLWSPEKSHEDIILMWPLQIKNLKKNRKNRMLPKNVRLFLSVCNIVLRNSCL